jgi:hypothetical protein
MKNMVLFAQGSTDIKYILSLYDENKESHNITIIVVNILSNYVLLNGLNLKAQIEFIPVINKNKIIKFIFFVFELRRRYKSLFQNQQGLTVYFFAVNYDYVTAFFIERLLKNNEVYFFDVYKKDGPKVHGLKNLLNKTILKALFGIRVKYWLFSDSMAYQYLFDKNKVHEVKLTVNEESLSKYKTGITTKMDRRSLLYLDSNDAMDGIFTNPERDLASIFDELSKIYDIYIKPHPRLGYSKVLDKYNVEVVGVGIPSELLSYNNFEVVLGVYTTSLATIVHENKISIISLLEFNNSLTKTNIKRDLDSLMEGHIKYVKHISEI